MVRQQSVTIKGLYLLLAVLALSSCSAAPTRRYVQTSPSFTGKIEGAEPIAIICDALVLRGASVPDKAIGNTPYICVPTTKIIQAQMLEGATRYLRRAGHTVNKQLAPFVGAYLKPDKQYMATTQRDGEIKHMTPPFAVEESMQDDAPYRQALVQVLQCVQSALANKEHHFGDAQVQSSLMLIAKRTETTKVLFVIGEGPHTSIGKRLIPLSYINADFSTWTALVDTQKGEIVWANSLKLKDAITVRAFFLNRWAKFNLYHFPQAAL